MNINIEFAHTYVDHPNPEPEHVAGCKAVRNLIDTENFRKGIDNYSLNVMIDEYHPKSSNLILTDLIEWLEDMGVRPHWVVMEGDMRIGAYRVLYSIPKEKRQSLTSWIDRREKFPCSLLTATWYLYRLGVFPLEEITLIQIGEHDRFFVAEELQTVLPKMYEANEIKVIELLKTTPWAHLVDKIHYTWLDV